MSVPARLRWLLPGHSLLPVLANQGRDLIKCSQHLVELLAGKPRSQLYPKASGCSHPPLWPGFSQLHSASANGSDAPADPSPPPNVSVTMPTAAAAPHGAFSRASIPSLEPLPMKRSSPPTERHTLDREAHVTAPKADQQADEPVSAGSSTSGVGWARAPAASSQELEGLQGERQGADQAASLHVRMRRLRKMLSEARQPEPSGDAASSSSRSAAVSLPTAATAAAAAREEGSIGGGLRADRTAATDSLPSQRRRRAEADRLPGGQPAGPAPTVDAAAVAAVPQPQAPVDTPPATDATRTAAGDATSALSAGVAGGGDNSTSGGSAAPTASAPFAAPTADDGERLFEPRQLFQRRRDSSNGNGVTGGIVPDRLRTAASDAPDGGGQGVNGGALGGSRRGNDGGGAAAVGDGSLAAFDRDAELMRRIADLQALRDAEILLYDAGSWFRSRHAAAMLGRLPYLDLDASNAGARTRHLLRFLTLGMLNNVEEVDGPSLARTVAAYARLRYAPPEAVPQICSSLLSYYARKLRSCPGPELADLAWGLAALQLLYGDVHQAIKRPSYTARLAPGARIVGYMRAGSEPGSEGGSRIGSGSETAEELGRDAVAASELPESAVGAVQVLEGGEERKPPAQVLLESQAADEAATAALSDTRAACTGGVVEAAGDGSRTALEATAAGTAADDAAAAAEELAAPSLRPSRRRRRKGINSSASNAVVLTAAAAAAGPGNGVPGGSATRRRKAQDMIWMVPVTMERIWERLALAAAARAAQGQMDGEHLAKVAWAYAKVGIHDGRLFDQLATATLTRLQPFLDKVSERTAGGAAAAPTARYGAGGDAAIVLGPAPLDPTSVTNLAWAFVKVGHRHTRLLAALAAVAAPYKGMYDNDQVAMLARTYAEAGHYDGPLCTAFTMVACRRVRHLSGSQMAALVGSAAALRHRDDQLAGALARAVWKKREQLSAEEVCELMWATALLGLDAPLGASAPGATVLGLSPVAAGPLDAAADADASGQRSRRRGGGGGPPKALSSPVAVALATALLGRCGGLPPADLARALWALSVLQLGGHGDLAAQLTAELSRELRRHPPESFSRTALMQLYSAAHVLAEVVPLEALAATAAAGEDAGVDGAAAAGVEGLWDDYDDDDVEVEEEEEEVEEEGEEEDAVGALHEQVGPAAPGASRTAQPRVRLYAERMEGLKGAKAARSRGYCTAVGAATHSKGPGVAEAPHNNVNDSNGAGSVDGAAASAPLRPSGAAAGDNGRAGVPRSSSPSMITKSTDDGLRRGGDVEGEERRDGHADPGNSGSGWDPARLESSRQAGRRSQVFGGRRHRVRQQYDDCGRVWDPYDSSWSDVDWTSLPIPAPAAATALGAAAAVSSSAQRPTSTSSNTTPADRGAPSNALPYDVRQVYDEATGRQLWEVLPRESGGSQEGAPAGADPAGRLLPAGLLQACQAAAAEWAASELERRRAEEGEDRELWRLEVALALRDLAGVEPQQQWVTRQNTAVADLLLLPPGDKEKSMTHGSSPPPPPAPVAVLLLGPDETTRNPPYVPLGSARLRVRLLEAEGARVVVLPRFLWRTMAASPEDQICLLGNILGARL